MEALNILALWGVPKEYLLIAGIGGLVIVVGAIVAWFVIDDSEETEEETEKPKKEKKSKASSEEKQRAKEDKQRAKELKKQQKLEAKESKAEAKASKPRKEKKPKPAKAPKAVKVKAKKEKKVKAAKPVKAKKPSKPKKGKSRAMAAHPMSVGGYEYATNLVRGNKSVLLASCSRDALPVTIPVKVAMQLAMDGKCLLIDLDVRRDAIAKAFNLEDSPSTKCLRPMPYKTSFDNLFIWPSHNFVRSGHMNIKYLVRAAEDKYDHVLISCPCINLSPDRKLIAASSGKCIIFSSDNTDAGYMLDLISSRGGNVLANIKVTEEDEERVLEDFAETQEDAKLDVPLEFDESKGESELEDIDDLMDVENADDFGGSVDDIDIPELEGGSDAASEGPEFDAELDIEDDLDDLLGGDEDEGIDPDIINDLFEDDEEEEENLS